MNKSVEKRRKALEEYRAIFKGLSKDEGIDFIEENGQITDCEVQELLEIKHTRAYTLMKKMEKDGLIAVVGRGSSKKYVKKD